mgnify:FL=1
MRLFKQTPEDYYNAPYDEFPALIRGTVAVVMGILWVFSKLMWRWKVEDSDLLFERQEGRGSVVICNHTSMAELLAVETALFFGAAAFAPSLNPSSPRARSCAGPLAVWAEFPSNVAPPT